MRLILLTRGKFAKVDDSDYEWLSKWKWFYSKRGYACRMSEKKNGYRKTLYMHREILNPPVGSDVDHKDSDKCNNQRSNIRICTRSQNLQNKVLQSNNSSGYRGVYWNKQRRKYIVQIAIPDKRIFLGYFDSQVLAAKAYDDRARKEFGEFARTNFS